MRASTDILKAYGLLSCIVATVSVPAAIFVFIGAVLLASAAYASEKW